MITGDKKELLCEKAIGAVMKAAVNLLTSNNPDPCDLMYEAAAGVLTCEALESLTVEDEDERLEMMHEAVGNALTRLQNFVGLEPGENV